MVLRRENRRDEAMKAIVQERYGAPEQVLRLEERDRPPVGPGDALIRVRATSVNTPDWITVTGTPYVLRVRSGLRRPRTAVRGTDVAGIVEAVGESVADLEPGDEVFGSAWEDSLATAGTFAEFTVAPTARLIRKPAGIAFEEAAASVMSGITALIAVRDVGAVWTGNVDPGERCLGRRGDVRRADRPRTRRGRHGRLQHEEPRAGPGPSGRRRSSTTRRRTSPKASAATTSSSTTC